MGDDWKAEGDAYNNKSDDAQTMLIPIEYIDDEMFDKAFGVQPQDLSTSVCIDNS